MNVTLTKPPRGKLRPVAWTVKRGEDLAITLNGCPDGSVLSLRWLRAGSKGQALQLTAVSSGGRADLLLPGPTTRLLDGRYSI